MGGSVGGEKPQLIVDGKRLDGRGPLDLRPLKITVGVLEKANGSAMIEWGKNKIVAGVYGPREVFPKHDMNPYRAIVQCRYAMAPFCSLEEHGRMGPNRRAAEIGKVGKHVFENVVFVEQFPKTGIEMHIEILQSDGGTRVAGMTAGAIALADAGIPMKDVACGVSVGKINGVLVADLDKTEDNVGESDMPMVFSLRTRELLLFQMDGMLSRDEVSRGIDMGFAAAEKVREKQVEALNEKYAAIELEVAEGNGGEQSAGPSNE
ncbi:MAG: exosome complex exonuclease Rrp41 [Candidatus Micrarchaeia archaeon]